MNVLDFIRDTVEKAKEYNSNDQVAPETLLWPDKDGEWLSAVDALREAIPAFLTYGEYVPEKKTGPGIWLKCMIAKKLPEADWGEGVIPVLYLPGVSRQDIRNLENCPEEIQPIAEMQYRAQFFTQENARDWTLNAFVVAKTGGLGLDMAQDSATLDALKVAFPKLLSVDIERLRGHHLDADYFRSLVTPDPVRDLLRWLDEPEKFRKSVTEAEWSNFSGVCRSQFGFDPEADGEIVAAEKLGNRKGGWENVWQRFCEAPKAYPHLPERLRAAKPSGGQGTMFESSEAWPQDNEKLEEELRDELKSLAGMNRSDMTRQVAGLLEKHRERREWVWTRLGLSPLSDAFRHVERLFRATENAMGGTSLKGIADLYVEKGWLADAAAIDALAAVKKEKDAKVVRKAVRAIYLPWLEASAEHFQKVAGKKPFKPNPLTFENGTCVLFVDGLRLDMAQRLGMELGKKAFEVKIEPNWVGFPPVTPTGKPALVLTKDEVTGSDSGEDFKPVLTEDGKVLTHDRFKKLLAAKGFQVLAPSETGDPEGMAWSEIGELDKHGHDEGWKLAWRIKEEVNRVVERVENLIDDGWKNVMLVTDHGWLLVPDGMPKAEMPGFLVETRWGRCAILKENQQTDYPMLPWYWNPDIQVVIPPGVKCFKAGLEYAHGGVSAQECVVPVVTVTSGEAKGLDVTISEVNWIGLRCRITVQGEFDGCSADIRTRVNDVKTSAGEPKPVKEDGTVSLAVEKDELEGVGAAVVITDTKGKVVAKYPTTIGG